MHRLEDQIKFLGKLVEMSLRKEQNRDMDEEPTNTVVVRPQNKHSSTLYIEK
jgi:hypothetical protein